jgi:hypothetical protein
LFHTDYHLLFLWSLGLTVVVETAVLFLLLRSVLRIERTAIANRLIFAAGVIASAATIPYVWFVFPYFVHTRLHYMIMAESFAVLAEIPILAIILRVSAPKAFLLSFVCNMSSFGVGLLIQHFI